MSSTHYNKVKEIAGDLSKKGWDVKAYVPGYKNPKRNREKWLYTGYTCRKR